MNKLRAASVDEEDDGSPTATATAPAGMDTKLTDEVNDKSSVLSEPVSTATSAPHHGSSEQLASHPLAWQVQKKLRCCKMPLVEIPV